MKLKKFIACTLTFATILNGANSVSFAANENQKFEKKESIATEDLLDPQAKSALKSLEDLAKSCVEAKDGKVKEEIQAKIAEFEAKKSYLNDIKNEAKRNGESYKVANIEKNIKVIKYSLNFLNNLLKKVKENDNKSWKKILRILLICGPLVALGLGLYKFSDLFTTKGQLKFFWNNLLVPRELVEHRLDLKSLGVGSAILSTYLGSILISAVI